MGNNSEIISKVLALIERQGVFNTIERVEYPNYDINSAIEVVEAIGKSRNPNFVIDEYNRFAYENMIRWCHGDANIKCIDPTTNNIISGNLKKGLFIAGGTGRGKSWLLEIMLAYCSAFGFIIKLGHEERRLYWENIRTDSICSEFTESGNIERFKKMPIIGIQDLGAEQTESMYMGNRVNVLRQILENRGDRTDQITLITSNLPINNGNLAKMYDVRVASRLAGMCNYYVIRGEDRRK